MINTSSINWGGLLNTGFDLLKSKLGKKTGPVAVAEKANDFTAVNNSMPSWVLPVAIVGGVLLLFGKKIFRR